jgi:hypothetical protein
VTYPNIACSVAASAIGWSNAGTAGRERLQVALRVRDEALPDQRVLLRRVPVGLRLRRRRRFLLRGHVRVMPRRAVPADQLVQKARRVEALLLRDPRALRLDLTRVVRVLVVQALLHVLLAGLRAEALLLDRGLPGRELPGEALPGRAVADLREQALREARVRVDLAQFLRGVRESAEDALPRVTLGGGLAAVVAGDLVEDGPEGLFLRAVPDRGLGLRLVEERAEALRERGPTGLGLRLRHGL